MEEQWLAYEDNYAIFPQMFVPMFVPAEHMQKVLPWVLRHRHADKVGYEIDIAVVPLTGNATRDYSESHWWSGRKWRVNQFAMRAAMDYAPESKVRFYKEETARRVEEPGVVRYEWVSKSGVGNYDLSLGDPSITRLELSGHGLPSSSRQQMNFDFDFQYVILEGNCTFSVESPSGTVNVTEVMQPDEMFWVRAGVSHRINTVPPGAPLKLVALGGPWQPYTVEVLDDMVYNIFEDPNAQRVVDPQTFYRNADFRSYRFADTPWVRPDGFGDIMHKVWNKSMQNNDDVAYFSVKLAPNQWVRKHYHPTGAVYIVVKGSMTFPGEGRLDKFEVRWTAPDHFYAGERSDAKEETLLAVPGHLGPQFTSGPPHHNYLLEHRANLHVVHRDTSAHPMSRVAGRVVGSGSVASPRPLEPVYV
jgi:mannose-6-phosphate isomerase-like protein (cupin superfamily)